MTLPFHPRFVLRPAIVRRFGVGLVLCAALAVRSLFPTALAAAGWQPYANARFGFSLEVPQDFRPAAPPANGDGRTFKSADGRSTILGYGHFLAAAGDLAGDAGDVAAAETGDGLSVSYQKRTSGQYTISGVVGDRIVYIHAVLTCGGDAAAILRADYPVAQKARFGALVAHMAASLHGSSRC